MTNPITTQTPELPAPFCTAYGVELHCIGDEGQHLVAFGHVDKRRFFAACNYLARREWGLINLADGYAATWTDMEREIRHEYARIATAPETEYDWAVFWQDERDDEHHLPVTVWTA